MTSLQGNPSEWLPGILNAGEVMLESLIPRAWRNVAQLRIDTSEHEDKITDAFVRELRTVKRKEFPAASFRVEGQYQVNPATDDSGRVDIAVLYGGCEELYLAYECKWLEKPEADTLARLYMGNNGLGRFLSGKYAPEMPMGFMVGYVATGDLDSARERIQRVMTRKGMPQPISVPHDSTLLSFKTEHKRHQIVAISITHILLPC